MKPSCRDGLAPQGCSARNVLCQEVPYGAGRDRRQQEGHVMPKQAALFGKCKLNGVYRDTALVGNTLGMKACKLK